MLVKKVSKEDMCVLAQFTNVSEKSDKRRYVCIVAQITNLSKGKGQKRNVCTGSD